MEELKVGPVDTTAVTLQRRAASIESGWPRQRSRVHLLAWGPMGCPHASYQVSPVLIPRVTQVTSPSTSHSLIRTQHLHRNSYSCTSHTHHPVSNLGSRILAELEINLATKEENLITGLFLLTETRTHKLGIFWGLLST